MRDGPDAAPKPWKRAPCVELPRRAWVRFSSGGHEHSAQPGGAGDGGGGTR